VTPTLGDVLAVIRLAAADPEQAASLTRDLLRRARAADAYRRRWGRAHPCHGDGSLAAAAAQMAMARLPVAQPTRQAMLRAAAVVCAVLAEVQAGSSTPLPAAEGAGVAASKPRTRAS